MNNLLPKIFIAPKSGEQSSKHFKKTIEGGYKKNDIIEFLSDQDKESLKNEDILMVWGNKPSLKSRWEKMEKNDLVLFYQGGSITYTGKLLYKTHNKKLADELWGYQVNEKGVPVSWEYVYFLKDLERVNISYEIMANFAGYKGSVVQGFMPYSDIGVNNIIKKYGSVENFFSKEHPRKIENFNSSVINDSSVVNNTKPALKALKKDSSKEDIKKNYDKIINLGFLNDFKNKKNMDKLNFRASDKNLRHVLIGEEKYKIPRYQRPYSWTLDEVSDLWNDLMSGDGVFLGSFVFNRENYEQDGFVEVIDGQQRLITLTILMAVIRDKYKELKENKKASVTQDIIAHVNPITTEQTYRLKCGDSLDLFFGENIQKENSNILAAKVRTKEEKAIKSNYEFLWDQLGGILESCEDQAEKTKYLDSIKSRIFELKIILISIEDEEDAYSIFETVNARGADLTAADLLKNYIFSKLQNKADGEDVAKEIWTNIENNIERAKGPLNVSKFIRYYWISKYSFVSEKKLYREVKNTIQDHSIFLNELLKASEYYYKIASDSVGVNDWIEDFPDKKTAQKIVDSLNGLRTFGITQCYSLLFCLLLNKDKIGFDFSSVFKTVEKYHFAYSAVCKLSGNVVEKLYYKTAKEIRESLGSPTREKIIQNVQTNLHKFKANLEYPSKSLFIEKFSDIEYKNYPLVIYILSNIEKGMSKTEEKILNFTKVNIEHILPQEPSEWKLTKKDVKGYVNMLGNLTLIDKKINGSIGNKILKDKMAEFKTSELAMNMDLINEFEKRNYEWTEYSIKERQKKLAEFAYDIVWKFKD